MNKRSFGKECEALASTFLTKKGYEILERNFSCSFGEIDIIAKDGKTICFIEVKARRSGNFGKPLESVHVFKQNKMIKVAQYYFLKNKLIDVPVRFEAIGIDLSVEPPKIEHVENIFV